MSILSICIIACMTRADLAASLSRKDLDAAIDIAAILGDAKRAVAAVLGNDKWKSDSAEDITGLA